MRELFRKRGRALEKKYIKRKEQEGYRCIQTTGHAYHSQDFFGMFDVIGFRPDGGFLAQVKANQTRGLTKSLRKFLKHCPYNFKIIAAIHYDKGISPTFEGWREIEIE